MKVCIDTNIYVALKRNDKKILTLLEQAVQIIVPTIVVGELYSGFHRGSKTNENIAELNDFLDTAGVVEANTDHVVADRYGLIIKQLCKQGTPIPTNDVWIAATTFETASRLLTFDRHFDNVPGLSLIRP